MAHGKVPEELQGTKDAELPHNVEAAPVGLSLDFRV